MIALREGERSCSLCALPTQRKDSWHTALSCGVFVEHVSLIISLSFFLRSNGTMPKKDKGEYGVKPKQRSKKDKAARNFELNGTYSAKHVRAKMERDEKTREKLQASAASSKPPPNQAPGMRRLRSWGENSLLASLPDVPTKSIGKKK